MSQTVVLKVAMSCGGCSGAVERALAKMEGVESYDVSLKEQKVTVIGNVQREAVFETVSKTGKKTSFWEDPVSAPAPATASEVAPSDEAAPAPPPAAETAPAPAVETAPPAAEAKPVESVPAV